MTKLNALQIQELYAFTRKHYVEHYDLQTELVDHLANGIEEQMLLQSNISFKEALSLEFKKFSIYGFEDVILKRKRAMTKRYWKIIFTFFIEYFKVPKVLISITLIGVLFFLFNTISIKFQLITGLLFLIGFILILLNFLSRRKYKLETLKNNKKWMLKEQIYSFGNYINIILFIPNIFNFLGVFFDKSTLITGFYVNFFYALLISFLLILSHIVVFIVPKRAEELLEKTYPEYKMM